MQPNRSKKRRFKTTRAPLPKSQTATILTQNLTYKTGTINLQSLFYRRDFLSLPWCEFIWFTVFSSDLLCFSVLCFCLELIFCPYCFVLNQNKIKVLFALNNSYKCINKCTVDIVKSFSKICCVLLRAYVRNPIKCTRQFQFYVKSQKV